VEISPNLAAIANKRIEQEGWNNIHVVVGPAQTIALPGTFDGLLLFAVHEVLTSPEALDYLLLHLKKQGSIVAFEAKLSNSRRGRLGNPLLRLLTQTLLPTSSAPVDAHPWRFLEDRTGKLQIEERMAGFALFGLGLHASRECSERAMIKPSDKLRHRTASPRPW